MDIDPTESSYRIKFRPCASDTIVYSFIYLFKVVYKNVVEMKAVVAL